MKDNSKTTPIEIFCGSPWQIGMVKSLLEDSGIESFVQDDIMGTLNPWWTSPGGVGAIRLFILSSDYEKAKPLVDEYEKNLKE